MPGEIWARQTADPDTHKTAMLLVAGAAVAILGLSGSAARADEGLWTFDNFPAAAVKAKYGVTIDKAWLDRVRHAAARLSTGCSASGCRPKASC